MKTKFKRDYGQQLKNIYDALSESIMNMTDEEVAEEVAYLGEDMKANADELRELIHNTVAKHKKTKLREALSNLKELQNAKIYAVRLANTLRSQIKGLKEDDPEFVLCDDLPGVLTQIDNMCAVLSVNYKSGDYAIKSGKFGKVNFSKFKCGLRETSKQPD